MTEALKPKRSAPVPWGRAGRRLIQLGLALAVLFGTSGCVKAGISQKSHEVHSLFYIITWLAIPVFVFVEGMLLFCVWRYRQRSDDEAEPVQDYGNNNYVLGAFFIGPLIIVIILLGFGETTVAKVDKIQPNVAENVVVTGIQWAWSADYTQEKLTVSGKTLTKYMLMELPVNKVSKITLKSNDVIHEFYVPDLLYMKNAVPGHPNVFTIQPTKIGTYKSQCAQYCGLYHSRMKFTLKVVSDADFKKWVHQQKKAIAKELSTGCTPNKSDDVDLVAHHIQWDKTCIAVDPNKPWRLELDNEDAGIAHNFAIWDSSRLKHQFYVTPNVTGPKKEEFTVPALPAGQYYFQCNIHGPAMSGTFNVGPPKKGG